MPCSFHPHLHPSFVLVFSSHQCENTQETFTTMGLFTHLWLIRDLNVHWRRIPEGNSLYSTIYKQTLSQIRLLTCTSLSSAGSDRAQAGLHCATLKLLHGRPAIMLLMNGWTSGYWTPLRLWCMGCLVLGGWHEAAKLFHIYKPRFECGWEVWGRLLVVRVIGLKLQSAIMLLSKSFSIL